MDRLKTIAIALTLLLLTSCNEQDARYVHLAQESNRRQAEQNQEMAKLNHEVVAATERLVEADAKARQDLISAQRDLLGQQESVNQQRDQLESERRTIARERQVDSLLASAVVTLGPVLLALIPLVVCWLLLARLRQSEPEEALTELLVMELASEHPKLLPPAVNDQPRLSQASSPDKSLSPHEGVTDSDG